MTGALAIVADRLILRISPKQWALLTGVHTDKAAEPLLHELWQECRERLIFCYDEDWRAGGLNYSARYAQAIHAGIVRQLRAPRSRAKPLPVQTRRALVKLRDQIDDWLQTSALSRLSDIDPENP